MADQTVVVAPHDAIFDYPQLTGTSTPTTITIIPHDAVFEQRAGASPIYSGFGPVISAIYPEPLVQPEFWNARVIDVHGAIYGFLTPDGTLGDYGLELNGIGSGSISVPDLSNGLAPIDESGLFDIFGNVIDGREVGVYYGTNFLGSFIPDPDTGDVTAEINGPGPMYHLRRKHIGRINAQPNLLDAIGGGGSFDTDAEVAQWTPNSVPFVHPTFVADDGYSKPGAMRIDVDSAGDFYVSREITIDALPYETFIWFEGYAKVVGSLTPGNSPTNFLGLYTQWSVGPVVDYANIVFEDGVVLDWRRAGVWQRVVLKVYMPADQQSSGQLQVFGGLDGVIWDDISVKREERLYIHGGPEDAIALAIANAQDPGLGKVSLGITVDATDSSGTAVVQLAPKFHEHANVFDFIREMSQIDGGVNFIMEQPAENQRVVHTMPRLGLASALKPELRWGFNIAPGFRVAWNIDKRADVVGVIGRGEGTENAEGFAVNTDTVTGWETITYASIEGSVIVQPQADAAAPLYRRPLALDVTVYRAPFFEPILLWLAGDLKPGRIVWCEIDQSPVHVAEDFIVVASRVTPEANTVSMTLVAVATIGSEDA